MRPIGDNPRHEADQGVLGMRTDAAGETVGALPPYLRALEAEAIHVLRETAAAFRNPVLLYSIGKDSTVLSTSRARHSIPHRCPFPCFTSTPSGSSAK
jgi:3'-phosphoadenosine 5'-phosphosulfate sulfotransferase (PAPS reductase)/FAD synthetase